MLAGVFAFLSVGLFLMTDLNTSLLDLKVPQFMMLNVEK